MMHQGQPFENDIQRHLPKLLQGLLGGHRYTGQDLGNLNIPSGTYLFSQDDQPMYIGILAPTASTASGRGSGNIWVGTPPRRPCLPI